MKSLLKRAAVIIISKNCNSLTVQMNLITTKNISKLVNIQPLVSELQVKKTKQKELNDKHLKKSENERPELIRKEA